MTDGERRRHGSLVDPELATSAHRDLELDLPSLLALREELVGSELLERHDLELRGLLAYPRDLERVQDGGAPVALLGVEERVRNRDRHLVPKLGRADRVAVDQDVGHGAILSA